MTVSSYVFPRRGRALAPGQRSELTVIDLDGGQRVLFTADEVIEAPNWTPDGQALVFNAGGRLFKISVEGGEPELIESGAVDDINNDHVLSPDGRTIYASAFDGHIHAIPIEGTVAPRRVSNDHSTLFRYYLHGISPDGETLAYVAVESPDGQAKRFNIFTIPAVGGPDRRLTDLDTPNDGPEFSSDGRWLYFNSELAATTPGHAQIFRMRAADGGGVEQLTFDEAVNWFPHLSPDGRTVVILSYPAGTEGHPADKPVRLRLMDPDGANLRTLVSLFGGQGTINVNSWAPDSRSLAFVAYPLG
jgi:TolB protein